MGSQVLPSEGGVGNGLIMYPDKLPLEFLVMSALSLYGSPSRSGGLLDGKPRRVQLDVFLRSDLSVLSLDSHCGHGYLITLMNHCLCTRAIHCLQRGSGEGESSKNNCKWRLNMEMLPGSPGDDLHEQSRRTKPAGGCVSVCTPCRPGMGTFNVEKENAFNKPPFPPEKHLPEECMLIAVTSKVCDRASLGNWEPSEYIEMSL